MELKAWSIERRVALGTVRVWERPRLRCSPASAPSRSVGTSSRAGRACVPPPSTAAVRRDQALCRLRESLVSLGGCFGDGILVNLEAGPSAGAADEALALLFLTPGLGAHGVSHPKMFPDLPPSDLRPQDPRLPRDHLQSCPLGLTPRTEPGPWPGGSVVRASSPCAKVAVCAPVRARANISQ